MLIYHCHACGAHSDAGKSKKKEYKSTTSVKKSRYSCKSVGRVQSKKRVARKARKTNPPKGKKLIPKKKITPLKKTVSKKNVKFLEKLGLKVNAKQ